MTRASTAAGPSARKRFNSDREMTPSGFGFPVDGEDVDSAGVGFAATGLDTGLSSRDAACSWVSVIGSCAVLPPHAVIQTQMRVSVVSRIMGHPMIGAPLSPASRHR